MPKKKKKEENTHKIMNSNCERKRRFIKEKTN